MSVFLAMVGARRWWGRPHRDQAIGQANAPSSAAKPAQLDGRSMQYLGGEFTGTSVKEFAAQMSAGGRAAALALFANEAAGPAC